MTDEIQTVEEPFEVEKEFMITSLETLKVLSDPIRLRILETLVQKAMTVKDLAKRLGTTSTKLYYHINLMEEHGLIKVVSQRIVSGIVEKHYRTRAKSFDIDKSLLAFGQNEKGGPLDMMLQVVFDSTKDDVRRAIEMGIMNLNGDDPGARNGMLMRAVTKLDPERLGEFHERLLNLIREFESRHIAETTEGAEDSENDKLRTYGFTVALFPLPDDIPRSTTIID